MPSANDVSATQSPQIQAAILRTTHNAQKQEGEAVLKLIESAVEVARSAQPGGPKPTGNYVDISV